MTIVDTHVHVFTKDLPMTPGRRYTPAYDATLADYLRLGHAAGIHHAVMVQPSFLGCDNSHLIAALQQAPDQLRGIAVVDTDISADALSAMRQAGVVGIRLNLDGVPLPAFHTPAWRTLLDSLAQHDMLVEVHREARDLHALIPPLLDAGLRVVVDHFGRPDDHLGSNDPGFHHLLSLADTRRVWVKLAAGYRNGWTATDTAMARAVSDRLLEHFGSDRLVWGSDWPHTRHEHQSIAATLEALRAWIPDDDARTRILGRSALDLFGF